MWYNLSLEGILSNPGYLYKLGVYTKNVTVSALHRFLNIYFKNFQSTDYCFLSREFNYLKMNHVRT